MTPVVRTILEGAARSHAELADTLKSVLARLGYDLADLTKDLETIRAEDGHD